MNASLIRFYPSRADWLTARTEDDAIGASDVPCILTDRDGVSASPWGTPWTVWAKRKAPHLLDDAGGTADTVRGTALEPAILRWYADEAGVEVAHYDDAIASHPTASWARMSPDGIRADGLPVEAKLVRYGTSELPPSGPLTLDGVLTRPDWYWQVVWECVVLGADVGHLAVAVVGARLADDLDTLIAAGASLDVLGALLRARGELRTYTIETPAVFRDALLTKVGAWRDRHLVAGEEPSVWRPLEIPVGYERSAKDEPTDALPEADDDLWALVEARNAAKAREAEAAGEAKAATEQIAARLDAMQATGVRRGKASIRWQVSGGGERIPALSKLPADVVDTLRARGLVTASSGSRFLRVAGV